MLRQLIAMISWYTDLMQFVYIILSVFVAFGYVQYLDGI